jgi:4-diphosphocytidyl-2-C-methyl-D-erythritol kinase
LSAKATLVARAFAKINVGLEVLGRRDDGYHELRTILQTVALHDELSFCRENEGISFTTNDPDLGTGPENLVVRAASLLAERAPGRGVTIHLEKNVPAGMGLGGGSADAAVTLLALDQLWDLHTPAQDLHRLAASLGMDVPFFLYGGTALALGRGDEVYPLAVELDWPIVLILPDFSISTASAYASLRLTKRRVGFTLQHFVWRSPSVRDRLGELVNHLEGATGSHTAHIQELKRDLLERGALAAMMSGSGSAVFGVFEAEDSARSVADSLTRGGLEAVSTHTLTRQAYREQRLPTGRPGRDD